MPRYKRIRVRGKPRAEIDVDLLAQALIMASKDIEPFRATIRDAE